MPDYNNNPNNKKEIVEKVIKQESSVDVSALANAISQAFGAKFDLLEDALKKNANVTSNNRIEYKEIDDGFDNKNTMSKLAEQMIVERSDNKANFKDLGNIKTTKRDNDDLDSTIDLLSNLDD